MPPTGALTSGSMSSWIAWLYDGRTRPVPVCNPQFALNLPRIRGPIKATRKQPARYLDKVHSTAIKKPFNNEFIETSAATPSQSATNSSAIAEDDRLTPRLRE